MSRETRLMSMFVTPVPVLAQDQGGKIFKELKVNIVCNLFIYRTVTL